MSDELKAAANFGLHLREEQLTANNIELDSRKIAQSLYDEVTEVKSDLTDVKKDPQGGSDSAENQRSGGR